MKTGPVLLVLFLVACQAVDYADGSRADLLPMGYRRASAYCFPIGFIQNRRAG